MSDETTIAQMVPKHTPGPWQLVYKGSDTIYLCMTPEAHGAAVHSYGWYDMHKIALAGTGLNQASWSNEAQRGEWVANANLIAAAPNLLAGCVLAVALLGDTSDAQMIQEAIDVALGRPAPPTGPTP